MFSLYSPFTTLLAALFLVASGTVHAQTAQYQLEKPTISRAAMKDVIRAAVDAICDIRLQNVGVGCTELEKKEQADDMLQAVEKTGIYILVEP